MMAASWSSGALPVQLSDLGVEHRRVVGVDDDPAGAGVGVDEARRAAVGPPAVCLAARVALRGLEQRPFVLVREELAVGGLGRRPGAGRVQVLPVDQVVVAVVVQVLVPVEVQVLVAGQVSVLVQMPELEVVVGDHEVVVAPPAPPAPPLPSPPSGMTLPEQPRIAL
jgi:hypothetical protein